jgi:hypothetical protein
MKVAKPYSNTEVEQSRTESEQSRTESEQSRTELNRVERSTEGSGVSLLRRHVTCYIKTFLVTLGCL